MSKVWSRMPKITGRYSRQDPPRISLNNDTTSDPHIVAELFSQHFEYVSSSHNYYSLEFLRIRPTLQAVRLNFTPAVLGTLKQCRNTAPGEDGIRYEIQQYLNITDPEYMLTLFNMIWNGDECSDKWMKALILASIKPIKLNTELGNYRPIALASCIGKLMEKIVNIRLMNYV